MTKYKLLPEHEARFPEWREWWIANAFSCEAMTDSDRQAVTVAVRGLYQAAELPHVPRVLFVASPFVAAIASGVAAGVWYLREHPEQHRKLFGRDLSDEAVMAAIAPACALQVAGCQAFLRTGEAAATRDATSAATDAATDAATSAATRDATDDATSVSTDAATRAATSAATRAATDVSTSAATDAATSAATRAATRDATSAATDAATDAATSAATRDATSAATRDATRDATSAATSAATRDATSAATDAATDAATSDATALVSFLVRCAGRSGYMRNGGNHWSGWGSYLSFFRYVAELPLDYAVWDHYETCLTRSSWRYAHQRFCVVSDRPSRLGRDDDRAPHHATAPSHAWRDGFAVAFWRGTRIPSDWLLHRATLDPSLALTWPNIEQRRALAEIIGWDRIMQQLSPRVIDTDPDPEIGVLLEADLPDSPREHFLKVRCGTGRDFVLPVPPSTRTALEANAWTYGIDETTFKQSELRT